LNSIINLILYPNEVKEKQQPFFSIFIIFYSKSIEDKADFSEDDQLIDLDKNKIGRKNNLVSFKDKLDSQ
jgi:hypothetical protein